MCILGGKKGEQFWREKLPALPPNSNVTFFFPASALSFHPICHLSQTHFGGVSKLYRKNFIEKFRIIVKKYKNKMLKKIIKNNRKINISKK